AKFSHSGSYSVIVTSGSDSATSAGANLVVRSPRPGDIDGSFALGDLINGEILSVAVQSNGKILAGGGFAATGGAFPARIARFNPDGTTDYTFTPDPALGGLSVWSIAVQTDGKVLLGGQFWKTDNGTNREVIIARLTPDGSLDTNFITFADSGFGGGYGAV